MANEPMKRCSTPEVLRETNVTVRHTSEDGGDTGAGGGVEGAPPPRPGGMGRGTAHRRQLAVCALGWPRETEARGHADTCPERARRRRRPSPPGNCPGQTDGCHGHRLGGSEGTMPSGRTQRNGEHLHKMLDGEN